MINRRQLFFSNLAQTSDAPIGIEIERAENIYLYDSSGKRYIDFISGISVSSLGHNNINVNSAIKKQVDKHLHLMVYGEFIQESQTDFASLLTKNLPENLNSVYFVNSGSEAVEGALKLAKRYTGRTEIISYKNAYHGSSHGALSIMGNESFKNSYRPLLPDIKFLNFNNINELEMITSKTACVIIEPLQGEAGVIKAGSSYLKALRKRCNETGTLLIFDEIQSGMGRTGKMFAFEHYAVTPDILLLAKALGGGMPLGAFISSREIMSTLSFNPVLGHITTFGGHPVCCAAGKASMQFIIENNIATAVNNKEKIFLREINKSSAIKEIRSFGLLIAVELQTPELVKKTIKKCIENGLIADWFLFNENSLRIAPPLIISDEQIIEACKILNQSINASLQD